jgi:twinkle protein
MNLIEVDDIDWEKYRGDSLPKRKVKEKSYFAKQVQEYFEGSLIKRGSSIPFDGGLHIGLRPSEVSVWAGVNGHGKSLLLGQVVLGLMEQDQSCLICSFEMRPEITLARMARQATCKEIPNSKDLERFYAWKKDKLFLLDHHGMIDAESMFAVIRYAHQELGVKHIVIDSLMKCVKGEDSYNEQKDFVNTLCSIAQDTELHIHLVHHMRKGNDENHVGGKFDLKGSGSISDQVDNVFIVWRNKNEEKSQVDPDGLLICAKQRNGEWEGKIRLWFDKNSQQYTVENGRARLYMDGRAQTQMRGPLIDQESDQVW